MRTRIAVLLTVFAMTTYAASGQTPPSGPWDISVDVGAGNGPGSVNPSKPVARIGDDDYLAIQILVDGKVPREDRAQLRFAQPVLRLETTAAGIFNLARQSVFGNDLRDEFTERGSSHLIRFRKCSVTYLSRYTMDGHAVTKDDCPFIIANSVGNVTVYANTDSIALDAEVDTSSAGAGPAFAAENTKHAQFTIRTVRPWWNLNFSTGFSFFAGDHIRDEQYTFAPIQDDPATPNIDESKTTDRKIVPARHGETPYELGAFATYMLHRPSNLPIGITFGVSTKVPVDQLTAVAGLSVRIEPFPIVDSAYLTAGIAYRGHKVLMAKYRDTFRAPTGISETDILESRHDIGVFVAASFGFGGGETQFKKVVSGQ